MYPTSVKRAAFAALLSLACSASAFASEAFVLQIPKRNVPNQEIGEVRITLGLDLPPAGAQLSVDGTLIALGNTTTVGGDEVSFLEGSGNSVRIVYKPLSNFGADFCAGANAVEKNPRMQFVGAQDVLSYRVSTYIVAAPQFACGKVSRRTGETPANVIPEPDGNVPLLDATFRGRHELDVVLVLDASGSMGEKPPGATSGPSKAELLRSALTTFVAQWAALDAPFEGSGEWPADRIGVVFFDDNAVAQTIAGGEGPQSFLVRRGPGEAGPSHPWNQVSAAIDTLAPGLSTTVGGGINEAMKLQLGDPKNDLALVVVTDGIQNTSPLIEKDPSGLLTLEPPSAALAARLAERFVPIQTVGFGTPAAVDAALLESLAEQTAGVSFIAIDDETIFDSFAITLVSLLKGNTAALASRIRGNGSGEHAVLVDPSAQRVVFSLQWAPPHADAEMLEVFRPGSNVAATPTSIQKTKQSVIFAFDTKSGDNGVWHVRVKPTGARPVPYTLNTFVSERSLDYRLSFDSARTRTGEPIRVRASVAYDGKPLKGLPPNAIRVRVRRPAESLGTILHLAKNASAAAAGNDPQSPYQAKVAGVVDTNVLQKILPLTDITTITLTEEKNGVYAGTFADTSVAGAYAFDVVLDWDDPRTGKLHREDRMERTVSVSVDPARTDVRRRGDIVLVTPRDRFGNYAGPGYASLFNTPATDAQQTGTYELTPTGPITFDGVALPDPAPAPSSWRVFLDAGTRFPGWSVNAGLERVLSPAWSVEAIAGRHEDVNQFSLGGKRWLGSAFVNFGAGVYDSEAGAHVGLGWMRGMWEVVGNVHATDGDTFATLQIGIRFGL